MLSPFKVQAGEILVKQGKYDDAVNAYTKIKDKYFQSYQAMDIDKYIEQAKLMKNIYHLLYKEIEARITPD